MTDFSEHLAKELNIYAISPAVEPELPTSNPEVSHEFSVTYDTGALQKDSSDKEFVIAMDEMDPKPFEVITKKIGERKSKVIKKRQQKMSSFVL